VFWLRVLGFGRNCLFFGGLPLSIALVCLFVSIGSSLRGFASV
jgi:hypothetical protein